jgi:hypothetical protein
MNEQDKARHYLQASNAISLWVTEYKRYLLDGDPNVVHPKARAALTLAMTDLLDRNQESLEAEMATVKPEKKRAAKFPTED